MNRIFGFVFIELLLVIFIISLLAAVAIPAYTDYILRTQVSEGIVLAIPVQKAVSDYYAYNGRFPTNNQEANLLNPEQLTGTYVSRIEVIDGTIQINYRGDLAGQVLSFQPQMRENNPLGMVIWQCGQNQKTTLASQYLPTACKK